jgi:uncharacterized protein YndB with AHSA1/START domain
MTKAQHVVRIGRPNTEVFDFLADGTNNPRWQPMVVKTTGSEGALKAGAMFHQRVRHPFGFTVSADYCITTYDAPYRLALTVTSGGPIRPTLTYVVTPEGESTVVHCTVELHPSGLARLATPLLVLLHPLYAWEAAWIDRARDVLESADSQAA